jgi:hypothetical protein
VARPEGLEPPAYRFEACRSIQLSYGRESDRTLAAPATVEHCGSRVADLPTRVHDVARPSRRERATASVAAGSCATIEFCVGPLVRSMPPHRVLTWASSSIGRAADS